MRKLVACVSRSKVLGRAAELLNFTLVGHRSTAALPLLDMKVSVDDGADESLFMLNPIRLVLTFRKGSLCRRVILHIPL